MMSFVAFPDRDPSLTMCLQVTPGHHADRENIREAQTRIEVGKHR